MKSEISNTTADDIPSIQKFLTPHTASWFGHDLSLSELIEKSYICVGHRHGDEMLSIICVDDIPPVTSVPSDTWLEWTREIYNCSYLSYKNSVFIHLLAWSTTCEESCVEQLLIYVYEHYHFLEHILLVIPTHVDVHSSVLKHFLPMRKVDRYEDTYISLPFYVNSRSWTLPKIEIKLAEIPHAHYIMEIIAQKQPDAMVSNTHQLMKELNEPQDTEYKIRLVALKEDKVVAFMVLDTRVDLHLLQDNFDMSLYIQDDNGDSSSRYSDSSYETISDTISSSEVVENYEDSKASRSEEDLSWRSKAFAVLAFAVDSSHEYVVPLILKAAFRTYCPDCGLCVAASQSGRTSPLFKFMNPVLLKQDRLYPSELYALSKAAALGTVSVRPSTVQDTSHITWLLEYYEHKDTILQDVLAYLCRPDIQPSYRMVTICVDTHNIIGFALLSSEVNFNAIESDFLIHQVIDYTAYHYHDQALIKYFVLSFPFLTHGRFIVKEILRQFDLSCLLYLHNVTNPTTLIPEIIQMMFLVRSREVLEYPAPSGVKRNQTPSSLYFINKKITSLVHATNHVRTVVVGASRTGLSFLENLILDRAPADPCFTRVTLITKHGLWQKPHKYQTLAESIMVHDGDIVKNHVACTDVGMWVTVRMGLVTGINTEEKYVITSDNQYKQNYEYLFLTTQLKPSIDPIRNIMVESSLLTLDYIRETNTTRQEAFQTFLQEFKHISHGRCEANLKPPHMKVEADVALNENMFCISNIVDAGRGLDYVDHMVKRRDPIAPILIIGNNLGAIACVHALLSLGAKEAGYEILLIEPHSIEKTKTRLSTFDNDDVIHAMIKQLMVNHVGLLREVRIYEYGTDSGRVIWVKVESADRRLFTLKCSAVFVFEAAGLEKNLYNALSEANVLMYQKILIDAHYETSAPSIYAAGQSTKYISRLFAEETKYFSELEIGHDLSRQYRNFLSYNHRYENDELPKYTRCKVEGCILPGGYNYLHVYKPGKRSEREYTKPGEYYRITTGQISDPEILDPRGYFQILFDKYKTLIDITCVSRRPLRIGYTIALYGRHAGLLNNIIERHKADPIPDLYAFFEHPWTMALYHFKFNSFLDKVSDLFHLSNEHGTTLLSLIERTKASTNPMSRGHSDEIRRAFVDFQIQNEDLSKENLFHVLINKVVQFLELNADQLPMYATSGVMEKILPQTGHDTPRTDHIGEPCGSSDLPERGYHLPRTEPEFIRDVACLLRDDTRASTSDMMTLAEPLGTEPREVDIVGRMKPCQRDILKTIRDKRERDLENYMRELIEIQAMGLENNKT